MSAAATTAEQPAPEQRRLTPGVRRIGGASLLADVGHEVPTSLLTELAATHRAERTIGPASVIW